MRLDKDICLGAKLNHEELAGLKLNGEYIFETTGPDHLNIYTIRIPYGISVQATLWDNDDGSLHYENNYYPYIDWGVGQPVIDKSGKKVFTHYYNTSGMSGKPGYKSYSVRTTCELVTDYYNSIDFPGRYVVDIVSVRTDCINGDNLFSGYSGVKTIREPVLEKLNTGKFDNMYSMFEGCTSLEKLNLSSFDTSKVTTMDYIFSRCSSLTELDLSSWDTSNVTNMGGMFRYCTSLVELDLSNFNIGSVYMNHMFCNCTSLTNLDVSSWDTSKVIDMSYMFDGCESLKTLDLSNFYTNNATNMWSMFANCSNLEVLDIRNFDTSKVTTMTDTVDLIPGCTSLRELRLDNCNHKTVSMIVNSVNTPTDYIDGGRYIYCTRAAAEGLTPRTNWQFRYVD